MKTPEIYNATEQRFLDAFGNQLKIGDKVILCQKQNFYKACVEYFIGCKVAVCGCFEGGYLQLLFKLPNKLVLYNE